MLTFAVIFGLGVVALVVFFGMIGGRDGRGPGVGDSWKDFGEAPAPALRPNPALERKDYDNGAFKVWFSRPDRDANWSALTSSHQDVVGEQYHGEEIARFLAGADHRVEIRAEPDNPYDRNALAVDGVWVDMTGERRACLGYLPRELAAAIVTDRPAGLPLKAEPVSCYVFVEGNADLKIAVLEPSKKSGYWGDADAPEALDAV